MNYIKDPMAIEVRSFEIIKPYIEKLNLDEAQTKIYSRIIHASGDVDYAPLIRIHKDAVEAMKKALLSGCKIYTDVEMVRPVARYIRTWKWCVQVSISANWQYGAAVWNVKSPMLKSLNTLKKTALHAPLRLCAISAKS